MRRRRTPEALDRQAVVRPRTGRQAKRKREARVYTYLTEEHPLSCPWWENEECTCADPTVERPRAGSPPPGEAA